MRQKHFYAGVCGIVDPAESFQVSRHKYINMKLRGKNRKNCIWIHQLLYFFHCRCMHVLVCVWLGFSHSKCFCMCQILCEHACVGDREHGGIGCVLLYESDFLPDCLFPKCWWCPVILQGALKAPVSSLPLIRAIHQHLHKESRIQAQHRHYTRMLMQFDAGKHTDRCTCKYK